MSESEKVWNEIYAMGEVSREGRMKIAEGPAQKLQQALRNRLFMFQSILFGTHFYFGGSKADVTSRFLVGIDLNPEQMEMFLRYLTVREITSLNQLLAVFPDQFCISTCMDF